jgi:hypothetical protein
MGRFYGARVGRTSRGRAGGELLVVKRAGPKRGVVLLPRRWVVERTFSIPLSPDARAV